MQVSCDPHRRASRNLRFLDRWIRRFAVVAVVACCAAPRAASAQALASREIIVRSYNAFGLTAVSMQRATAAVIGLLDQAGITAHWRDCRMPHTPMARSSDACDDVLSSRELVIRIVGTPRAITDPVVLGYSHVDPQTARGTLATVFADRVRALAPVLRVDEGTLLGRAIAHEIGHLLLGTRDHADAGLMRGFWSVSPRPVRPSDWLFSYMEAARMRESVYERDTARTLTLASGSQAAE